MGTGTKVQRILNLNRFPGSGQAICETQKSAVPTGHRAFHKYKMHLLRTTDVGTRQAEVIGEDEKVV